MDVQVITAPDDEPIGLEQAKLHLRVDGTDEDALIGPLIKAARQHVESVTGLLLMPQAIVVTLECWEAEIMLPRAPIVAVDSIAYTATDGATATLAAGAYVVRTRLGRTRVRAAAGTRWPPLGSDPVVEIRCAAGFADAEAVPEPVRQAMLLLIGHWYRNREALVVGKVPSELQFAVDRLLEDHRMFR